MDGLETNLPLDGKRLCVNNGVHQLLSTHGLSEGKMVTFSKPDKPPFRADDISNMMVGDTALDLRIARFSADMLSRQGLALPLGADLRNREALIHCYMLVSSLCYVSTVKRSGVVESYMATKLERVPFSMYSQLSPADKKRGTAMFPSCFGVTEEEITSGKFDVLRLTPSETGLKMSKEELNIKQKGTVTTMYAMDNYTRSLTKQLCSHQFWITYIEDGRRVRRLTSLNRHVLAKWLRVSPAEAHAICVTEYMKQTNFGYLVVLPDLNSRGVFFKVPLVSLESMQRG